MTPSLRVPTSARRRKLTIDDESQRADVHVPVLSVCFSQLLEPRQTRETPSSSVSPFPALQHSGPRGGGLLVDLVAGTLCFPCLLASCLTRCLCNRGEEQKPQEPGRLIRLEDACLGSFGFIRGMYVCTCTSEGALYGLLIVGACSEPRTSSHVLWLVRRA